jgi:hypothetical protein
MRNLTEYIQEKQNTIYTLAFGKNEPLEAHGVKGTHFKVEFIDVIDCGKTIMNSNRMDEFAEPLFKEHYKREMKDEPKGKDGGVYYTYAAGDHSKEPTWYGSEDAKITNHIK